MVKCIWPLIKKRTSSNLFYDYYVSILMIFYRIGIKQIPLYDVETKVKYDVEFVINKIMPEVTSLIKYEHENIVKYLDNFATKDFLYVVTDYCQVYKIKLK